MNVIYAWELRDEGTGRYTVKAKSSLSPIFLDSAPCVSLSCFLSYQECIACVDLSKLRHHWLKQEE